MAAYSSGHNKLFFWGGGGLPDYCFSAVVKLTMTRALSQSYRNLSICNNCGFLFLQVSSSMLYRQTNYTFSSTKLSWSAAKSTCELTGGSLLVLDDTEVCKYAFYVTNGHDTYVTPSLSVYNPFFIYLLYTGRLGIKNLSI